MHDKNSIFQFQEKLNNSQSLTGKLLITSMINKFFFFGGLYLSNENSSLQVLSPDFLHTLQFHINIYRFIFIYRSLLESQRHTMLKKIM